jgi:hypothetical protein
VFLCALSPAPPRGPAAGILTMRDFCGLEATWGEIRATKCGQVILSGQRICVGDDFPQSRFLPNPRPLLRRESRVYGVNLAYYLNPLGIWNAGIGLGVKPASLVFDSDVHLPTIHAESHQIGLVVIENLSSG